MIRNFITTSDLAKLDVAITRYLPQGQTDWSLQIAEAFEQLKDLLRAKKIESRRLGLPIDLNRSETTTAFENTDTSLTKTASFNGTHVTGIDGFRRFVVNVSAMTGASGYVFKLQGSNDIGVDANTEPTNWTTITTLTPTSSGELTAVFQNEYRWYRLTLTVTAVTPSITFTAGILETYMDRWIVWLSLSLIYRMISKGEDAWIRKAQECYAMFEGAFDSYQFTYDVNNDNIPKPYETLSGSMSMMR